MGYSHWHAGRRIVPIFRKRPNKLFIWDTQFLVVKILQDGNRYLMWNHNIYIIDSPIKHLQYFLKPYWHIFKSGTFNFSTP